MAGLTVGIPALVAYRWVLSKALSKKGFTVDLAANGTEALALARQQTYDLAVLDIKMPGITGLDLLARFQEDHPQMLVVIMTAESSMKNWVSALGSGVPVVNTLSMRSTSPRR